MVKLLTMVIKRDEKSFLFELFVCFVFCLFVCLFVCLFCLFFVCLFVCFLSAFFIYLFLQLNGTGPTVRMFKGTHHKNKNKMLRRKPMHAQ